jgi:hypothetical protein
MIVNYDRKTFIGQATVCSQTISWSKTTFGYPQAKPLWQRQTIKDKSSEVGLALLHLSECYQSWTKM